MFVLNVDLWNEQGGQEVNLCRQPASTGAPSLSATSTYSYTSSGGEPTPAPVSYSSQISAPNREPHFGQPPTVNYVQDYHAQSSYGHGKIIVVVYDARETRNNTFYNSSIDTLPSERLIRSTTTILPSRRWLSLGPKRGYCTITSL